MSYRERFLNSTNNSNNSNDDEFSTYRERFLKTKNPSVPIPIAKAEPIKTEPIKQSLIQNTPKSEEPQISRPVMGPEPMPDIFGKNTQILRNETLGDKYNSFISKAKDAIRPAALSAIEIGQYGLDQFNKSKVASFGAGANPLTLNESVGEFAYGKDFMKNFKETKEANPITAKIGEVATSLIPMAKASQVVSKLPYLSKLGSLGMAGKVVQGAVTEGIAGAGYGAVEGLYKGEGLEGANDNAIAYGLGGLGLGGLGHLGKYALPTVGTLAGAGYGAYDEGKNIANEGGNLSDNIGRLGTSTLQGGAAGLLAGKGAGLLGKGLGNLSDNTLGFSKGIKKVGQSIDNYKAPQIREDAIDRLTRMKTNGVEAPPTINPTIPTKYQQPLPKINEPLMLNRAEGTYLRQKAGNSDILTVPTTETTTVNKFNEISRRPSKTNYNESNVNSSKLNPENLQGMEKDIYDTFSKSNTLTTKELEATKRALLNENGKIFEEQLGWMNSVKGKKPNQGSLSRDMEGVVTNRNPRTSNNELWYQEWAKENRIWNNETKKYDYRKITQKEMKDIAEKQISEGFGSVSGSIPKNDIYTGNKEAINAIDSLISKVKDIKQPNQLTPNILTRIPKEEIVTTKTPNYNLTEKLQQLSTPKKATTGIIESAGDPTRPFRPLTENIASNRPILQRDVNSLPVESNLKPLKQEGNINSPLSNEIPLKSTTEANTLQSPKNATSTDVQNKISELETIYKQNVQSIKNDKVMDPIMKAKRLRAIGESHAAQKRSLIQGDSLIPVEGGLAAKELENKIKYLKSNHAGKEVSTPHGEGVATGKTSFGNVEVKLKDGKIVNLKSDLVKPLKSIDGIITGQKYKNITDDYFKISAEDDIFKISDSNSSVKPNNSVIPNDSVKPSNYSGLKSENNGLQPSSIQENTGLKQKNRQFIENSYMKTDVTTPKMKENMKKNIPQYETISNQETLDKAKAIVDSDYDVALDDFLTKKKLTDAVDTAVGEVLIQKAIKSGKYLEADRVALNLAEKLTNAGQIIQAASMMKRMTPEGMLTHIKRTIKDLKGTQLSETQIKSITDNMDIVKLAENGELKLVDINLQLFGNNKSLTEQLQAMAKEGLDSPLDIKMMRQVSDAALDNVTFIAANNLPVSRLDKVNAWRRMAMLANPKTHIRNAVGNTFMMGLRKAGDTIGAGLEKVLLKQADRTKSIGWSKDEKLVNLVDSDWNWHKKALMKGGKFDLDTVFLNQEKQIFEKGKITKFFETLNGKEYQMGALEKVNQKSRDWLNASDNIFLQRAYKDALGGFMKARGLTSITDEARLYATRRGYESVFKQANEFSNWISRMKAKGGVTGTFLEAKIPFSKTPSNIVMRGVEYSPLGLVKAMYGKATGKTGATVIEDLAKGLTGTGIFGLGLYLANMGWARTEGTKSKALRGLAGENAEQPYSISTPHGSYTFEWAQPMSIPLAMGIAAAESLGKKNKGEEDIKTYEMVLKGLAAGGDTVFNTTMLRNVTDMFGGKYASPTEALLNAPEEYMQQMIPSVLGQITRSVDGTKRDTSGGFVDLAKSKIPFLSKTLPAKVDLYGREEKQPGAIQQFLSPGTYKADEADSTSKELLRLNKATGETKFLPSMAQDKLSYQLKKKGESHKLLLQPNDKEKYGKDLGEASKLKLDKLIRTPKYINASDKEKVKILDSNMNKIKEKSENTFLKSQGIRERK